MRQCAIDGKGHACIKGRARRGGPVPHCPSSPSPTARFAAVDALTFALVERREALDELCTLVERRDEAAEGRRKEQSTFRCVAVPPAGARDRDPGRGEGAECRTGQVAWNVQFTVLSERLLVGFVPLRDLVVRPGPRFPKQRRQLVAAHARRRQQRRPPRDRTRSHGGGSVRLGERELLGLSGRQAEWCRLHAGARDRRGTGRSGRRQSARWRSAKGAGVGATVAKCTMSFSVQREYSTARDDAAKSRQHESAERQATISLPLGFNAGSPALPLAATCRKRTGIAESTKQAKTTSRHLGEEHPTEPL